MLDGKSGREAEQNVDYRIMAKDKRTLYVALNICFIKDEKGEPIGAMVIAHDITERKRIEKALRKSEEALRETAENKNQFLNALSHELRNPLAAISAGLQVLDITDDDNQIESARQIMKRQMNQLSRLVDDLLDLTRIMNNKIELKKENVDLNILAKTAAADQSLLFEQKGIRLTVQTSGDPLIIHADPVRIRQMIGNLLHNSYKFTERGGETIVSAFRRANEAMISVKDNGMGIKPEFLSRVFDPFVQSDMQLDRRDGGLGLGLAITNGMAQLHSASVTAHSEGMGKGSEFRILFPIEQAQINDITTEAEERAQALRVLLIDDNQDFCKAFRTILEVYGNDVHIAYRGEEGIEMAKELVPQAIFCDIGLPNMDGYEVARRIRSHERLKDIFLVAVTGYAGKRESDLAHQAGFDMHIAKPIGLSSLKSILNGRAKHPLHTSTEHAAVLPY